MTKILYMEDSSLTKGNAVVEDINELGDDNFEIILDETVFYPKGGGQPADRGSITTDNGEMEVEKVYKDSGLVYHCGKVVKGQFQKGDKVSMEIDKDFRYLNSRLHSYAHLIDEALYRLMDDMDLKRKLEIGKCFFYIEGPSIEYVGELTPEQLDYIKDNLQKKLDELIEEADDVQIKFMNEEELKKCCKWNIKSRVPLGDHIRVLEVGKGNWIACGGTHVNNVGELKGIKIKKYKYKKNIFKVSYELSN